MMSKMYFTLTGTRHYYGCSFLKPGMRVELEKEPDNKYDKEAIVVKLAGLDKSDVLPTVFILCWGIP